MVWYLEHQVKSDFGSTRIPRSNFYNKSHEVLKEKMEKLLNQDTTMIDLPARCVGQNINLVGTYIIDLGIAPTIISA